MTDIVLRSDRTYLILFTRGRVDKQKTLSYLTPKILKRTIVVTCESEIDQLVSALEGKGIHPMTFVAFPDTYRLNLKRYLMAKWILKRGGQQFMFADDDLSLQALSGGKYRSTRTEEGAKALDVAWGKLDKLWTDFSGIGVSASSRNNINFLVDERKEPSTGAYIQENTKNAAFFGYRAAEFVEMFKWAMDNKVLNRMAYIDLLSNVLFIANGTKTGRLYDIAWSTTYSAEVAAGGMNAYRNSTTNTLAILMVMLFAPGSVTEKKPPNKTAFDEAKVNRQAWKSVDEWKEHHFDWKKLYDAVNTELRVLKEREPQKSMAEFLDSRDAARFVRTLHDKVRAMATGVGANMRVSKNLEYEEVYKKALRLAKSGATVYVEDYQKPSAEGKHRKLRIYQEVVKNWRKLPEVKGESQ